MTTHRPAGRTLAPGLVRAAIISIAALGVLLRLRQYLFNRSLWYDEALLAEHVAESGFAQLLDAINGAPFAFLAAARALILALGRHDWALRLVPLVAGLLTLELARRLADRAFRHAPARLLFLALCAFAAPLVFYASEFKPYAVDVCVALLVYLLGAGFVVRDPDRHSVVMLALAGAAAVWLSWASVFVLAAVGLTLWVEAVFARDRRAMLVLAAIGVAWIASFGASYVASLSTLTGNSFLDSYWTSAYAPSPLVNPGWYRDSALGLVRLAFESAGPIGMNPNPSWWSAANVAIAALAAAGFACLLKSSPRLFAFALVSIAATVLASGLHAYPFSGRLILFLVPAVFLALSALVDSLASLRPPLGFVAIAVALALTGAELREALPVAWKPFDWFDIKGALEFVRAKRVDGDRVAISVWSRYAWSFYAPEFGLDGLPIVIRIPSEQGAGAFLREAQEQGIHGRVWIVFSHRFNERFRFFSVVDTKAKRLASWEGVGAGAYLVDLP
ncbi:MAG TPA: hypothetical protein VN634_00500 [Candidatus Limnocylindrales bacterium]|nr:hypothetical protein [Candidatus Limnocylindrales bacterium]